MNRYTITISGKEFPIAAKFATVLAVDNRQFTDVETYVTNQHAKTKTTVTNINYFWLQYQDGKEKSIIQSREFYNARAGQSLSLICDESNMFILSILNHNTKEHLLYKHNITEYFGLMKFPRNTGWAIFGLLLLFGIPTYLLAGILIVQEVSNWITIPSCTILSLICISFIAKKSSKDTNNKNQFFKLEKIFNEQLLQVADMELNRYH